MAAFFDADCLNCYYFLGNVVFLTEVFFLSFTDFLLFEATEAFSITFLAPWEAPTFFDLL